MELARAYKFRFYPDAKRQLRMNLQLAHPAYSASLNRFIQMLPHKAESAGMKVIKADAGNTLKECGNCGNIQEMPISISKCNCNRCGMRLDRDINAPISILHMATPPGQMGSHVEEEIIGFKRKASLSGPINDKTHPLQDAMIA